MWPGSVLTELELWNCALLESYSLGRDGGGDTQQAQGHFSISLDTFNGGLKPALLSWVELHLGKVFPQLIIFFKAYFAIILPAASAIVLQPRRYHQEKLRCLPVVPAVPTQLRGPLLWWPSSLSCYFRLHNTVWTEINHQLCRLLFHQTIFLPSRTVPRLSWLLGVAPQRKTQRASCLAWEGLEWPRVVLVKKCESERKEGKRTIFFFFFEWGIVRRKSWQGWFCSA